MINIEEYRSFKSRTFGLGQDVAHDLTKIVKVPALFVEDSIVCNSLKNGELYKRTIAAGADKDVYDELLNALGKEEITHKQLISVKSKLGRAPYASGLIRALYNGQGTVAIKDWPALNYLSVAIGMGLLDYNYSNDTYTITTLGREAVDMLDGGKDQQLKDFMLDRLFEYPYAAWLIRLMNKDRSKKYSKFDLGANFGFIDEPGFISLPEDLYVDAMFDADANGGSKKKIKSNYESTADKYMRWLTGVFQEYGLIKRNDKVYQRTINGKEYAEKVIAYSLTLDGIRALNRVDGGSRFKRSPKRVRWEYLAPKAESAKKKKTARALLLKFLSEKSSGLTSAQLSQKINAVEPSIQSIPEQVEDDAIGLNRLGIEIKIDNGTLTLKDNLLDFVIPVNKNHTFKSSTADQIKQQLLPKLTYLDHTYLQAVDIAYKNKTSNQENTQLEILSTNLFTKEMDFEGKHLGGPNKPDGFAYDSNDGWIIDTKAYHEGFHVAARNTDAMTRYIEQYRKRNDRSTWWKDIPSDLPCTQFIYVSSFFVGNYKDQIADFETRNNMKGSLMEITKLILLAEQYKAGKLTHSQFKQIALTYNR
ncbi:restriction endonuclease FokI C-terminal domain-containing protein [Limosilactobacillus pontis]|uniref:restriction endonuclease FokI C-terminal domain-containing protein n=1 Tax=Limosilactobacillus pontis TaxID=35787 RepID=UPI0025A3C085|nr:restriction endonuclease FokI C-terminal domain-containing protein [Limosilactobacillus pontis]MDM8332533.1 restriction endonuclease FokI C-terminal domain-containing protein [Limosilactobacillus pontis]